MPNHLQFILQTEEPDGVVRGLRRLCASFAKAHGMESPWRPIPEGKRIASPDKVLREVRYVHLNPCRPFDCNGERIALVGDPLAWEWSTHRDVMGAIVDPWVTLSRLHAAVRDRRTHSAAEFHSYVSSDPDARVSGTPLPVAAIGHRIPVAPLGDVCLAAAAATRSAASDVQRRGVTRDVFVWLARHQGWRITSMVAEACGIDPRTVRRASARPRLDALAAAALCLGDRRLMVRTSWAPPPLFDPERPKSGRSARLSR